MAVAALLAEACPIPPRARSRFVAASRVGDADGLGLLTAVAGVAILLGRLAAPSVVDGLFFAAPLLTSSLGFLGGWTDPLPPLPPFDVVGSVPIQGSTAHPGRSPSASQLALLTPRCPFGPPLVATTSSRTNVPAGHAGCFFLVARASPSSSSLGGRFGRASRASRLGLLGSTSAEAGMAFFLTAGVAGVGPSGGSWVGSSSLCQFRKARALLSCFRRSRLGTPASSLTHGGRHQVGLRQGGLHRAARHQGHQGRLARRRQARPIRTADRRLPSSSSAAV